MLMVYGSAVSMSACTLSHQFSPIGQMRQVTKYMTNCLQVAEDRGVQSRDGEYLVERSDVIGGESQRMAPRTDSGCRGPGLADLEVRT
jgi:hypothetical protein